MKWLINRNLNFVIHKLPSQTDENVLEKVNGLIHNSLNLPEVSAVSAERKESRNPRSTGIVIAKCMSLEDKKKIMSNKRKLKDSDNYKYVIIDNDKPLSTPIMESNLRAITTAVGRDKLILKGGRLVKPVTQANRPR